MSQPRTRWSRDKLRQGETPWHSHAGRILTAIVAILSPLGVLGGAVLSLIGNRSPRRLRGTVVFGIGVLATFGGLAVVGGLGEYFVMWRDLWAAIRHAAASHGPVINIGTDHASAHSSQGQSVGQTIAARWGTWLRAEAPASVGVALMRAGWVIGRRSRFQASWRDEDQGKDWNAGSAKERVKVAAKEAAVCESSAAAAAASAPELRWKVDIGDGAGGRAQDLVMPLGVTTAGKPCRLTGQQFLGQLMATGPSGLGKTTTFLRILHGWLVIWAPLRLPAILFDFKGDPDFISAAAAFGARTGRQVHVVSLGGSTGYNPVLQGTSEEVASRIVDTLANKAGGGFTEPHHRTIGERWLRAVVAALDDLVDLGKERPITEIGNGKGQTRPWRRDLGDISFLSSPAQLTKVAPDLTGHAKTLAYRMIAELKDDAFKSSAGGMRQRVALLTETGAESVLATGQSGVGLEAAIRAGDIVVFSLDAAANSAAAQDIGNLALGDLKSALARLQQQRWAKTTGKRVLILLDEFGALGGEQLVDLLERARSAGGTVLVSAQAEENFDEVSEAFGAKVRANALVQILHQQTDDAASSRAEAIGTEESWQETHQVMEDTSILGSTAEGAGVGTLRQTRAFRVHPDELKQLQPGQVILFTRTPFAHHRVWVTSPTQLQLSAPQSTPPARGRGDVPLPSESDDWAKTIELDPAELAVAASKAVPETRADKTRPAPVVSPHGGVRQAPPNRGRIAKPKLTLSQARGSVTNKANTTMKPRPAKAAANQTPQPKVTRPEAGDRPSNPESSWSDDGSYADVDTWD